MNRTYNTFVDNGLFILAYYLNKNIQDITEKDIENNIDMMSKKIEEFFDSETFSNLRTMTCQNSYMTQKPKKGTRAEAFAQTIKNFGLGEDCCEVCGEYKANSRTRLTRSYFPTKTANSFYNFSNNLMGLNICSHCVALAMYSVLNCRVASGKVVLYNSDNNDFMKEYTNKMQEDNMKQISIGTFIKNKREKETKLSLLTKLFDEKQKMKRKKDKYYIEITNFVNSGQSEKIEYDSMNSKSVKLLEKLYEDEVEEEFMRLGLGRDLLNNKLNTNYIYRIYDFEKEELKCSIELFDFLKKEVNQLNEELIQIIEKIAFKVELDKKLRNELKGVFTYNDFNNFLVRLNEDYYEAKGERLFTTKEYLTLSNKMKFKEIKNLLLVSSLD